MCNSAKTNYACADHYLTSFRLPYRPLQPGRPANQPSAAPNKQRILKVRQETWLPTLKYSPGPGAAIFSARKPERLLYVRQRDVVGGRNLGVPSYVRFTVMKGDAVEMEAIHIKGIWMAEYLQQQTNNLERFWLTVTHFGDPQVGFLFVFPLTYFVCNQLGVAVLWVSALSEWLNLMLKWVLFGERPFWWIGECQLFVSTKPHVSQFPYTCETGPGSPSGHSMVTAAVWWVVVPPLSSFLHSRTHCWVISAAPYLMYGLLLGAVGISRIFILAHFPHQVVTGIIAGIFLGIFLGRRVPEGRPLLFFVSFSAGMLFSALILNVGLQLVGIDLLW
ncbi:hypothetical protein CCH79_00003279 [Gambusia affinis]|uniref:Glucose-6-phosphatase 3 n=1 Tax=Gambusia affinis TaxID=33528 RepID=A0A315VDA4_GAMAF|nr:hypothetical protein CCH79_00003279 [Gambusia affinis]